MAFSIVITTYPDAKKAAQVARNLVRKKLVACVNIVRIRSIYSWEGKIEDTTEFLMIMKTLQHKISPLCDTIKKDHTYEVPEIAEIPVRSLNKKYLEWVIDTVK